jgi:hypothetical protein
MTHKATTKVVKPTIRRAVAALKKAGKADLADWLEAEWNNKEATIKAFRNGPANGW